MPQITVRDKENPRPDRAHAPRLWNTGRKILGNLIPVLTASPFVFAGIWQYRHDRPFLGFFLLWMTGAVIAMWLSVNFLGLFQNESIKRVMRRRLEATLGPKGIPPEPFFVGFARPTFHSPIDPHEDVGFLLLFADHAEFFGDRDRIMLPKSCLVRTRYRPNPHSWAFLGGWVSLEGVLEGKPVRMLLEPREGKTLWANRGLRSSLKSKLDRWLQGGA